MYCYLSCLVLIYLATCPFIFASALLPCYGINMELNNQPLHWSKVLSGFPCIYTLAEDNDMFCKFLFY